MEKTDSIQNRLTKSRTLVTLSVVLIAGFLVMALEMLALRIIQAGISGDIFATGAVIGVVLTALTLGYWIGGTLSVSLKPNSIITNALVISGIWIFLLAGLPSSISGFFKAAIDVLNPETPLIKPLWQTIPDWVIENPLSESMSVRNRVDPLLASLILFFIPSVFLAMIGPCAIQTLSTESGKSGKVSGWVFALGSLGSIAGVICTSFWLIAILGITANLRIIGMVAILSGIALIFSGRNKK